MENKCVIKNCKTVDLFLFMGQSNMAGRGIVSEKWAQPAPQIMEGAGYEYRAISVSYTHLAWGRKPCFMENT